MSKIFFWIKKDTKNEWDTIEKALGHKYIKRIPNPTGKTKWYYIYAETFKKPFKALAEIFGIKESRINVDYDKENINKDYGVDKKTFAAHVLEFFTNKEKWNKIFCKKQSRDKYKEPIKQKELVEYAEKVGGETADKKETKPKNIINRTLMRKVWTLYSSEGKQIEQKEKDINLEEKQNGKGTNNIEQGRVSERDSDIWRERGIDSGGNGDEIENRTDRSESELDTTELGIGLGIGENAIRLQPGRGIPGQRLTKSEIKDIRSQVRELLNSKKDDEFTEADKALLRQYEGAGGLGENDASISGTLYEYYTPQNVVNKVWELVDKYNPKQDKKVIEPASGTGRFAEGRSENFTMFELEEVSSRINKILHPNAKVVQGFFQENFIRNGMFTNKDFEKFDVAVGNPPYGKYEGRYKGLGEGKEHTRIDEYFLDRTLDTLKDGGILAMVVPSSFLSSKDSKIKQKLEGKANLLEAWRLPNGTFGTTGVGTDIIILRKEKGIPGSLSNGTYFENNPTCIVGTETERTGRFGNLEKYVALEPGQTFDEAIATISTDAIAIDKKDIPIAITEIKKQPDWVGKVTTINRKTGKVTRTDTATGKVTVLKEGDAEKTANRSEAMKGNKNAEGEHDVQKIIGTIMDAEKFNAKYGKNISKEELEIWKVSDVDGYVNINALSDEMRNYIEKSGNYVLDQTGKWEHVANFASGNIVDKLEKLESEYDDKTDKNYLAKKELLENVKPDQKRIDQLDLSPLENWTRDYKVDLEGQEVSLIDAFFAWAYNGRGYYESTESPITPFEIPAQISWQDVRDYINKVPVKAERLSKDASKDDRAYAQKVAQKTRDLRRQTAEKLFNRFLKDGLNKTSANTLCNDWNRQFNSHVNPDYKKIPVFVDGMCSHKGSKDFTLLDQQIKGISFLANKGSGLLAYDVGVGKALADSEIVLTPKGWVKNGAIKVGDFVIGDDGKPAEVLQVFPQGEKEIYRVWFSDGSYVDCTKEHLWNVQLPYMRNKAQNNDKSKFNTVELQSFMNDLYNNRGEKKYSIPMCKPVELEKRNLKIDPYLMGVLLGDGCIKEDCVNICLPDEYIKEKIKPMLKGCELKHIKNYDYRISFGVGNPIVNALREYGLLNHNSDMKYIPDDYLYSNIEDRISLLNGLMDTDGYVDRRGMTSIYYTTSIRLEANIVELVNSLGGTVSLTSKQGRYKKNGKTVECKVCNIISIRLDNINPFTLPKKAGRVIQKTKYKPVRYIVSVEYSRKENATCIWINNDSHLYLTRNFIVTHNTAAGIVATVNQIQTGRCKKPLICVPKAVYKKWISEIHQHFPNQKVFELGNLSKQYFKEGNTIPDGAITVCTYEALKKITFKDETLAEISEDAEYNAINPYNSTKEKTARDKANEANKVETLVGEMTKTTGKDTYYFEDLGFDHITVDEVHNFKNVFSLPRNYKLGKDEDDEDTSKEANEFSKIRGSSSDRGKKMFAITQYIQRHNDNRNVFALSATPFTNSPTEIYSMLSLVARHRLHDLGIYSLHEFLAKFAELRTEYVVQPDNSVKEEQVVKSFKKLQALQNLITEYIDKVDGDEAKVIRPQKVTHTPELEMTDLQKQMMQEQIDYMQNAPKDDTAATIVAMNNMRMITLAPAIVDSSLLDQFVESSPKLKFVCDSIIAQYKNNSKNGQVMYMPRGVEHFDKVVDYLVKNGMPKDAIGVMAGGASTDTKLDKREALKNDFNNVDGKCKVLIGSGTIQEGVSLNGNSTTIYNCMLGWNPSETQQVEGRIWRQGNKQGVTHVVYPLMNDSIDALMYQKYDEKQSRIDALWKYKGDSLNVSDIDPEELKYGLIKDPEKRADLQIIKDKETLDNDVRQLGMQIDILHKTEKLAFHTDVEEECKNNSYYSKAKAELKERSNFLVNMQYFKDNAENGEKLKKKLAKMDENEHFTRETLENADTGLQGYVYYDIIGGHNSASVTVKDVKGSIDKFIKEYDEKYKTEKQKKVSYERIIKKEEKRVNDLIANAKESLKRQSITNQNQLDEKITSLVTDMEVKKEELGKMDSKREEYRQKAVEDIKKNTKVLPSLNELVKQNVDSITRTLRPMDEVKTWIQEGRAKGKSKDQISREINERIGVKKSWCYFAKTKNGQIKMYVKKSVVDNFANSN